MGHPGKRSLALLFFFFFWSDMYSGTLPHPNVGPPPNTMILFFRILVCLCYGPSTHTSGALLKHPERHLTFLKLHPHGFSFFYCSSLSHSTPEDATKYFLNLSLLAKALDVRSSLTSFSLSYCICAFLSSFTDSVTYLDRFFLSFYLCPL